MSVLRLIRSPRGQSRIGRFFHDTSAITAVEFGLIALPFFGLLGATVDASLLNYRASQLQLTAENVARQLEVNSVRSITYQQFLEQYVCTWQQDPNATVKPGTLGKMFDCSEVVVQIQRPSSWSQADMDDDFAPPRTAGTIPVPLPGQIGVLRIAYPVNQYFNFLDKSTSRIARQPGKAASTNVVMGISAFMVEPGVRAR